MVLALFLSRRKKKCIKFTSADDMGSDDEENGNKRERESRDPDVKEEESDLENDDNSIASANSSGGEDEDDEELMPHFNDEDSPMGGTLLSPTLSKNGGIAVLANPDNGVLGTSSAFGSLFSPSELLSSANGTTSPASLKANGELSLGMMAGADMILASTPSNGEKDLPCALPLSTSNGEPSSVKAEAARDSSLTPMTTPEDQQDSSDSGYGEKEGNGSIGRSKSSEIQKPSLGAPAAVLSIDTVA